jgi:hypothetical protein
MNEPKFTGYNVLNNNFRQYAMESDTIDTVMNMINTSGKNRAQRKRLEKALAKTTKLTQRAEEKIHKKIYTKYKQITDQDFVHFNAIIGLVMANEYGWVEEDDNEQITDLFNKIQDYMRKYNEEDMGTAQAVRDLEDITGICLISDLEANGNAE